MASALKRLNNKNLVHPPAWLVDNIHYETLFGSRAYNLHNEDSDRDMYGFCIPPKRYLFPNTEGYIEGFDNDIPKFSQYEEKDILEPDSLKLFSFNIYNIVKFFRLCADNNPNMLQSLFTPETCVKLCTKIGQEVRDNRKMFLSKLCWVKFRAYAASQYHKVTHEKPTGKRKELVDKFGYDVKFASMTLKLLGDCEYIFLHNDLDLTNNSDELRSIRRGEWSLDRFKGEFEARKVGMESLFNKSDLPDKPDEEKIKDLLIRSIDAHYKIVGTDAITRSKAEILALREIDAILEKVRSIL